MPFIVRLLCTVCTLATTVVAIARFTNPPGPDGALTLEIGKPYTIEWENAGDDYSEISLGLAAEADGNIFWLLSNIMNYASQNYQWDAVALGNGITLAQGNAFAFLLVNGTQFGEQVASAGFYISNSTTSTMSSASSSPTTTATRTPSPTASSPSSGLPTGVKAGIGVGVAVGAIFIFAAILFIYRHRKRNQAATQHAMTSPATDNKDLHSSSPPYGQLAGTFQDHDGMNVSLMAPQVQAELSGVKGENSVHELDQNNARPPIYEAP